jgi:hypothetical protein
VEQFQEYNFIVVFGATLDLLLKPEGERERRESGGGGGVAIGTTFNGRDII